MNNRAVRSDQGRICVVSLRGSTRTLARCVGWELEDLLCELTGADLVAPIPGRMPPTVARVMRHATRTTRYLAHINPGYRRVTLDGRYDLIVVVAQFARDLVVMNALPGWRALTDVAICWLEEHWAAAPVPARSALSQFDYIVVNCHGSVGTVAAATGRPVTFQPPGIDGLLFCPWPNPPVRSIDVMNIGRRSEVTHRALLAREDLHYYYDSVRFAGVVDPGEHRRLYSNLVKRSRYFIANRAKFDCAEQTAGQAELGFRFIEGAAAGAVVIGDHPRGGAFDEHFGWEDSLLAAPVDAPLIGDMIDELDRQPERIAAIRRRNVVNVLRRHAWAHRISVLLRTAGLPVPAAVDERLERLEATAAAVAAGGNHTAAPALT